MTEDLPGRAPGYRHLRFDSVGVNIRGLVGGSRRREGRTETSLGGVTRGGDLRGSMGRRDKRRRRVIVEGQSRVGVVGSETA